MAKITCWLLDTRNIWPGESIATSAASALALIPEDEQLPILRKYHMSDARMSLASALLKRAFISSTLNVPWSSIKLGRYPDPVHGKPCYLPPDGSPSPIEFNVSHQAGLVAIVGCEKSFAELGVDIVCVNERDDLRVIDKDGLDAWVDIYDEFFSAEELWDMKYTCDNVTMLDGTELTAEDLGRSDRCCVRDKELTAMLDDGSTIKFNSDLLIDAKMRRFYTFYCYKEAYIKLTGEAMMAPWLKECEFRNVRAPKMGTVARCSTHGTWGEKVDDVEVWLKGKLLKDVRMEIQAFEEEFMVSTAIKPTIWPLEEGGLMLFRKLDLERDILGVARSSENANSVT